MEEGCSQVNVDLLGHCAFCRRRVSSASDSEEKAKAVVFRTRLSSFGHVWECLGRGREEKEGEGKRGPASASFGKYRFASWGGGGGFTEVPPMCQECGVRVEEVDGLYRELMSKVEGIRRVVARSRGCWLEGAVENNSSLEECLSKSTSTLQFLEEMEASVAVFGGIGAEVQERKALARGEEELPDVDEVKEEPNSPEAVSSNLANDLDLIDCMEFEDEGSDNNDSSSYDDDEDIKRTTVAVSEEEDEDSDSNLTTSTRSRTSSSRKRKNSTRVIQSEDEDEDDGTGTECESNSDLQADENDNSESESDSEEPTKKKKKQVKIGGMNSSGRNNTWQRCDLCNEKILATEITQHMTSTHNVQDYLTKCPRPACSYIFSNRFSLETLHLWHRRKRVFRKCREYLLHLASPDQDTIWFQECEICGEKIVEGRRAFVRHLKKHERDKEAVKNLTCPVPHCGEKFLSEQSIHFHLSKHPTLREKTHEQIEVESIETGAPLTLQKCPVCRAPSRFKIGEEMISHLKQSHSVENVIPCKQCQFVFSRREDLISHLYQHKGEGMLCDLCDDSEVRYSRFYNLKKHYFTAHQIGQVHVCEHCGKDFFTEQMLKEHKHITHFGFVMNMGEGVVRFDCDQCPVTFLSEKILTTHRITAHGAPRLKCPEPGCKKSFDRVKSLEDHRKWQHAASRDFKCEFPECDKSYTNKFSLAKHRKAVHEAKKKTCETCNKQFFNVQALRQHIESIHELKKHQCGQCGANLATAFSLRNHMRTHAPKHEQDLPFQCELCSRRYKYKSELSEHQKHCAQRVRINGTDGRGRKTRSVPSEFRCGVDNCPTVCASIPEMRKHREESHPEWKKWKCDQCPKAYTQKLQLEVHQQSIHLGIKQICEVCGKGFSSAGSLALHMNSIHLGISSHTCEVCGVRCRNGQHLTNHMRTHTGERPFTCKICSHSFRYANVLYTHMKGHEKKGDQFKPTGPKDLYKKKEKK